MKKTIIICIIGNIGFIIGCILFVYFKIDNLPNEVDWRCEKVIEALSLPENKEYYSRNECEKLDGHWELPFCFTPQKGKQGCPPKDKHLWEHQCYKSGEFLGRNDDVKGKGQNYICCKTFSLKYNNETI